MTEQQAYFEFLKSRSRLGLLYRRHLLYPRISRRLRGMTLDVGCGIGDMLTYRPDTKGVDINPHVVEYCRASGLPVSHMQADRIPHGDQEFGSVLVDNVLEHVLDPEPLLREVHRVLVPGGRLVVGVPGSRGWASDPDHKVYYDASSLRATIEGGRFTWVETFFTPLWGSARLERIVKRYCVYGVFERRD
jgi:SAM-dependent methyltransferase